MRLRPPDLEIPPEDPFRHDLLGRKKSAEALTELVRSTDESLVIGLDASWGQGKSTFLQMWMAHLRSAEVKAIYVNAWESDFSDSAFVSILGEIGLGIAGLKIEKGGKAKKTLDAAKKIGVGVIKRGIPAVVKVATAGVLDTDKMIEDVASEAVEKYAEDRIQQYEDAKKSIKAFREKLKDFASEVTTPVSGVERSALVIVIDELDRCRPSYAIDVLETVKHLFSVPGVIFLIAADWSQLGNVVKSRYGLGVDVDGYLRRFVDVFLMLPVADGESFIDAQFEKYGFSDFFNGRNGQQSRYERQHLKETFLVLFEATGCSLRDQERCFTLLGMAIRTTPQNYLLHAIFLAALIVLKVKNPSLYKKFSARESSYVDVLNYFRAHPVGKKFFEEPYGYSAPLEAYFMRAHVDDYRDDDLLGHVKEIAEGAKVDDMGQERAARILRVIQDWRFDDSYANFEYLLRKIDLVSEMTRQRRRS